MKLPKQYEWLLKIPVLPKMVAEGLKLLDQDTTEISGAKSNRVIMQLAKDAGVSDIYKNDDVPWCAVAQTAIAIRAGKVVPFSGWDRLRAASFLRFGKEVITPVLGDTLVFTRQGGGHVGIYIAEDETTYHVMGGNQGNRFSITRILKTRLSGVRRPEYRSGLPVSAIARIVSPNGMPISANEA
ncbi:MAG: TIGR02594 family protein [Chitinophagaceae bacterium]|nr:TIGR02594 family protein [Chitinophagaceae bacterium]